MSSIAKAVFQITVGLLVNKGRDWAAKKLKEGDLTDEKFRSLIVREIDDIKSKLDGLSRKDLLASISFFKEGISILYEVFEKASCKDNCTTRVAQATAVGAKDENLEVNLQSTATASANTVSFAKELNNLRLTDLDEFTRQGLSDAKSRFEDARRKATEAYSNESLNMSDRVLAMVLRVMGTILEKVDNPKNALAACRVCLEELHALPAVQKSFSIIVTGGFKSWFKKDERREIVAAVCHMNHAIYDVMQIVGSSNKGFLVWPCVDVETEKLDPLRDARVAQFAQGMGRFPVPWSFRLEGEGEHKVKSPICISTNKKEHLIVGYRRSKKAQVLDYNGKSLHCFSCPVEDGNADSRIEIQDIATDQDDNVYVLAIKERELFCAFWYRGVCVFDKDYNFQYQFNMRVWFSAVTMAIEKSSKKLIVLGFYWRPELRTRSKWHAVEVYETDGSFVRSFGEDILNPAFKVHGITAGNDERITVLEDFCVHVFTISGDHLYQFTVGSERSQSIRSYNHKLLCANEHVVYVLRTYQPKSEFLVSMYTKNGELAYTIHLDSPRTHLSGITMTTKGRIAILVTHDCSDNDDSIRKGEILLL